MMHPVLDDSLKNDLEPTMHPRLASDSILLPLPPLCWRVRYRCNHIWVLFVCFYILNDWGGNLPKDTL